MKGPSFTNDTFMSAPIDVALRALDESFVETLGFVGCACFGERGSVAALAVRVKRELRDDEDRTTHIRKGEVRLSFGIVEDAHFEDLRPQPFDFGFVVVLPDAEQYEKAFFDFADD